MMTQVAFTPEPPPLQLLTPWQGKMSQNFHSKAEVRRASWNVFEIKITEVVVYARDTYDFTDDDDTGNNSEYLGHWNKDDLI